AIRRPDAIKNYEKELKKYNRRRGKRPEQAIKVPDGLFGDKVVTGFVVEVYGQQVVIERPPTPRPRAYVRIGYDRSLGFTTHARTLGLLAQPRYNREL